MKAERELEQSLKKNNHFEQNIKRKRRTISQKNKQVFILFTQKLSILQESMTLLEQNEHKYINNYGNIEEASLHCFEHKEEDFEATKKRIHEFFKKRITKWH